MEPSLPSGYTSRPPRSDELLAVVDLIAAADTANIGEPDVDADDVRNDWEADDFDVEQDARVAVADDGELGAYAFSRAGYAFAIVHPAHRGRGLGTALLPYVEARTAARGNTRIKQQVDGDNDAARELLTRHGYAATQHYWRMRVDLGPDATLEEPDWAHGIRVRTYDAEADDPAAHALINEVFVEVEGYVPRDLETWRTESTGRLQFQPVLSWVIGREGRMVGVVTCEAWEAEGYVALLAVARDHRGLGLGRALLLAAFRSFRDMGLASASLSVHARNEAGKRLYESVGMRVAWRAERWEKALDA